MTKCLIVLVVLLGATLAVPLHKEQNHFKERIVGGSPAPVGRYPYQVSLRSPKNGQHFCGGSIITARHILTAVSNCTLGKISSDIMIVVGTNYLNSGGIAYGVEEIINYPNYNPRNLGNDIAILVVSDSIAFNAYVQPIGLANIPPYGGTDCVFTGWGLTSYPSSVLPNALQHIDLKTMELYNCYSWLKDIFPVTNSHVCAYGKSVQGVCKGDAGGPLVCHNRSVLCGILTFTLPCATGRPDVYTSVSDYRGWIKWHTGV